MSWLFGGYFGGWYILFGLGYVWWLRQDPSHTESWWMVGFGALAYFLFIPGLLFGLMPNLERVSAQSDATIRDGFARGAVSRGFAFTVGLLGSLLAMATGFAAWGVASLSSDVLSERNLGETGLMIAMVSLLMGTLLVIAGSLWLGIQLLVWKCRPAEAPPQRGRVAVLGALLLAWAGLAGWLGYRVVNATNVITVRLDYATLPPTDAGLESWLRAQPGIAPTVHREGNTVVVECAVSAHHTHGFNQFGNQVTVDYGAPGGERRSANLTEAAAAAGYQGLRSVEFEKSKKRW